MVILASTIEYTLFFAGIVCIVESQTKDVIDPSKCANGTFYSRDYKMCVPCSTCDAYSAMFSVCTPTSDTVCIKCADTSQPDLADHPACLQCPPCQPGEYMDAACTSNTTTVCQPCPDGSFNISDHLHCTRNNTISVPVSSHRSHKENLSTMHELGSTGETHSLSSYRTYCIPCASCENQIMITDCNASMDTECGACKKGYFRDPHRNRCNRCVLCYRGQMPIEQCKNGQPGKLCSEFAFSRTEYIDVPRTATVDPPTTVIVLTTSTENMSTASSTDTVSLYTSSFSAFDITIILLVIFITLILFVLIIVLKYKLKLLTKSSNLLDDSDDSSVMYVDDCFNHTHDMAFYENLAESTFTNDCENQQYCTHLSSVTEDQELTQKPDDNSSHCGEAYNFSIGNASSKPVRQDQLCLSTTAGKLYEIHGISRHEYHKNSR